MSVIIWNVNPLYYWRFIYTQIDFLSNNCRKASISSPGWKLFLIYYDCIYTLFYLVEVISNRKYYTEILTDIRIKPNKSQWKCLTRRIQGITYISIILVFYFPVVWLSVSYWLREETWKISHCRDAIFLFITYVSFRPKNSFVKVKREKIWTWCHVLLTLPCISPQNLELGKWKYQNEFFYNC